MIKSHINTKEITKAAIEILEQLENIEHFGHVGCHLKTAEQLEKDSKEILEKILDAVNGLQMVNDLIVDTYEV